MRRTATVVATLLTATGLGACTGAPAEARREGSAAIAPAPAQKAEIRPVSREVQAVAGRAASGVRNLPSAFRLPPGSRVTSVSDPESGAVFTLAAPDPEAVLSFYRGWLPQGAFTIVADRAAHGATSLDFRDEHGWAGTIFATPRDVTVAVKRA